MHFSIPETEECKDSSGSYTLYRIYVNGAHHCSVRYSQLHNLSEQISNEFTDMPQFPPKKFFGLSFKEKEERRIQLEKYLQQISHMAKVLNSDMFVNFFINAQKETQREPEAEVDLAVYFNLINKDKIVVNIKSYDQTEDVLEKLATKLQLNPDYVFYFGLFMVKQDNDGSAKIIRRLQEFESPYISLKSANKTEPHKILLRKSVFDLSFELELYTDSAAVEIIYIQAVNELSSGLLKLENSVQKQLETLKEKNQKKEFLKLISTQPYYGCLNFKSCICDYPEPETKTFISLGSRAMYFRTFSKGAEKSEIQFRITRIRCWKVSGVTTTESNGNRITSLEISFEYLLSKDNFRWINIKSDQAILISMSLQTIVDEIILKQEGKRIKRLSEKRGSRVTTPFLTRQKSLINADQKKSNEIYSIRDMGRNDLVENDEFISNDDL